MFLIIKPFLMTSHFYGTNFPISNFFPQLRVYISSFKFYNSLFLYAEYVNNQEDATDMKSITDRAAQTLLWTELFRGQ